MNTVFSSPSTTLTPEVSEPRLVPKLVHVQNELRIIVIAEQAGVRAESDPMASEREAKEQALARLKAKLEPA